MNDKKQTSRRQWMAGLLRGGVLTLFGGTSLHLLGRDNPEQENDCIDPEGYVGCRDCTDLNGCRLPRGLSVKQFLSKGKDGEEQNS
jgi:hypothetical protein